MEREIRLAGGSALMGRYDAPIKEELERAIKEGRVHSHPAWENLEDHIEWLKGFLARVG